MVKAEPKLRGMSVFFKLGDSDDEERLRELCDAAFVDQHVRQALLFCWLGVPEGQRNVDELERQFRTFVDRAIADCRRNIDDFLRGN